MEQWKSWCPAGSKRDSQENSEVSNFCLGMNEGTVNRDGDHCVERVSGVRRRVWVCSFDTLYLWHFIVFRNQDWDLDGRYRSEQCELIEVIDILFSWSEEEKVNLFEFLYNVNIYVYLKCEKHACMPIGSENKQILFESGRRREGGRKEAREEILLSWRKLCSINFKRNSNNLPIQFIVPQ